MKHLQGNLYRWVRLRHRSTQSRAPRDGASMRRPLLLLMEVSLISAERERAASPRFRARSLFDLIETWVGGANPITCLIDLSWIHRNRARNRLWNRLSSSDQLSFILHRFR